MAGVLLESSAVGDGHPVPGSVDAVNRLVSAGVPVRFLTNESQCTRRLLWEKLKRLGYSMPGWTSSLVALLGQNFFYGSGVYGYLGPNFSIELMKF